MYVLSKKRKKILSWLPNLMAKLKFLIGTDGNPAVHVSGCLIQSKWSKGSAVSTSENKNKNSKKDSLLAVLAVTS
jgi:hypothetical protein